MDDLAGFFDISEFARLAVYAPIAFAPPVDEISTTVPVIRSTKVGFDSPETTAFHVRVPDISQPQLGGKLTVEGRDWIILDRISKDGGLVWQLHAAPLDRYDGLVLFECPEAVDDGYTSDGPPIWRLHCWTWAVVSFGKGDERREAAREGAVLPATFKIPRNMETVGVTASFRLRYPVNPLDPDNAPEWDIVSVAPYGLNEAMEITARRRDE
ncbi:hypothetical protein [Sphingobium sp. YG1]|uniref:hypothetical protein n=1 Tax=Sphingobium sp. YG1 TaxID=2082188 RepID=UPI0011AEBDDE|nr:hypothetical protein [Sphingobium sp. YG1]